MCRQANKVCYWTCAVSVCASNYVVDLCCHVWAGFCLTKNTCMLPCRKVCEAVVWMIYSISSVEAVPVIPVNKESCRCRWTIIVIASPPFLPSSLPCLSSIGLVAQSLMACAYLFGHDFCYTYISMSELCLSDRVVKPNCLLWRSSQLVMSVWLFVYGCFVWYPL